MNRLLLSCTLLACLALYACRTAPLPPYPNPPAPGFDAAGSDAKAVAIADAVMNAMGGRKAWDETRCIRWSFFGRRTLVWDKQAGLARIEWAARPLKIIVNLQTGQGKVQLNGVEQTHPDSLAKYLEMGKKVWINDSYWLAMPFKLKDSGVTLKYLGTGETEQHETAEILQLTFKNVGVTPDNKYQVWVDSKTHLVTQWAYFQKYTDEKPQIQNPWDNYKKYGNILLAGGRGAKMGSMEPIEVMEQAPDGVFEGF